MGISCLTSDFKYVDERRIEYEKRRNFFCKAVDDLGWPCHIFEGAFYAWIDATKTNLTSNEFITKFKEEHQVILSSGERFGVDGFIRVPLVKPIPVLEEVIDRLKAFKSSF
jgi:aspartate/methionine/tyrosine aminotransferase